MQGPQQPPLPDQPALPTHAQDWEAEEAALYLATQGQFDPGRDGRGGEVDENLVSVICATVEKHQPSHPLLYECFRRQSYEPRELVVVDSGTRPSAFLQEKAKEDPRVVYRFFFCEEHGLEQDEDPLEHVMMEDQPEEVLHFVAWTPQFAEKFDANRAEVPCQALTLGAKRNVAVHLSRGSTIAHFNVGDLYAREYLTCMRGELLLRQAIGAIALAEWHAVELPTRSFRRLDIRKRGLHLPEQMRRSLQCARGFSYAYSRSVWEASPFPCAELPEGHLLRQSTFCLVQPPESLVLAARGYDKVRITGGSAAASMNNAIELKDLVDCSAPCDLPPAFRELLPAVEAAHRSAQLVRDGRVDELLEANGPAFFCSWCDAALALRQYLKQLTSVGDGAGGALALAQFSRAGGVVAEGDETAEPEGQRTQAGGTVRARLACATPGCGLRVHSQLDMGGYCCSACCETRGGCHGPRCEATAAPEGAVRAERCCLPRGAVAPPFLEEPEVAVGSSQVSTPLFAPKPPTRPFPLQLNTLDAQLRALNTKPERRVLPVPAILRAPAVSCIGSLKPTLQLTSARCKEQVAPARCRDQLAPARCQERLEQPPVPKTPAPVNITWFPGWSWRTALCRHCGQRAGWRYEKPGGNIFWALQQELLVERLPPASRAQAAAAASKNAAKTTPQHQEVASQAAERAAALQAKEKAAKQAAEKKAASLAAEKAARQAAAEKAARQAAEKEAASQAAERARRQAAEKAAAAERAAREASERAAREAAEKAAASQAAERAAASQAAERSAREAAERSAREAAEKAMGEEAASQAAEKAPASQATEKAAPTQVMEKVVASGSAEKAKAQADACYQAMRSFSAELLQQLASGIAGSDGAGFDQALKALKLDDGTRTALRRELMIHPGMAPLQAEQLIAKSFRGRVNTLRSQGLRKLRVALDQLGP